MRYLGLNRYMINCCYHYILSVIIVNYIVVLILLKDHTSEATEQGQTHTDGTVDSQIQNATNTLTAETTSVWAPWSQT